MNNSNQSNDYLVAKYIYDTLVFISINHSLIYLLNIMFIVLACVFNSSAPYILIGHFLVLILEFCSLLFIIHLTLIRPSYNSPIEFFKYYRSMTSRMKGFRILSVIISIFWVLLFPVTLSYALISAFYYTASYDYYSTDGLLFLFGAMICQIILIAFNIFTSVLLGKFRAKALGIYPLGCCACDPFGCCGPDLCRDDLNSEQCSCRCDDPRPSIENGNHQTSQPYNSYMPHATSYTDQPIDPEVVRHHSAVPIAAEVTALSSSASNNNDSQEIDAELRRLLTAYYYEHDPRKLKDIDDLITFIKKEGIDAFNQIVIPLYGTGLGETNAIAVV